jgi:hypothetical protein
MMSVLLVFLCLISLISGFRKPLLARKVQVELKIDSFSSPLARIVSSHQSTHQLRATADQELESFNIGAWLNPNTRGGVIVWSFLLTLIPIAGYNVLVNSGMDADKAGADVGAGFVALSMVGWASTYIFRVANKDMTYATQLKDYENAVLQKRLEELEDDEINALMDEIEIEDGGDM